MAKKRAPSSKKPKKTASDELPDELIQRCAEIIVLTNAFCDQFLNDEYKEICREVITQLCVHDSPIIRGKAESWAGGVIYSVGRVNFITDPSQNPHMTAEQIAKGAGISTATMYKMSREIWDMLELMPLHPAYTVGSLLEENPFVWMLEVDGFVVDIRYAPREVQVVAYEEGLIPWIPADREPHDGSQDS